MTDLPSSSSFAVLKDCVAYRVIQTSYKQKNTKSNRDDGQDAKQAEEQLAAELDEFVLYLTQEVFDALPEKLKSLGASLPGSGAELEADAELNLAQVLGSVSSPPAFRETLIAYSLANSDDDAEDAFRGILASFNEELSSIAEDNKRASLPPAAGWKSTRTDECEICAREVPLTYHHLIPRSTHDKVLRRKWHPRELLNVVAWLCRPCHTAVHRSATNEDLARYYYSVELLMQREEIQKWAAYASRQRWGVRRG